SQGFAQQPHRPLQMNPPMAGPFEGHAKRQATIVKLPEFYTEANQTCIFCSLEKVLPWFDSKYPTPSWDSIP
ncbi:MAG: hypothetical protein OQK59_02100, partial [Chlorobium sp.]|nr:hypothetical protein [Chlorobium sp.]